jgi:hypothetical protein
MVTLKRCRIVSNQSQPYPTIPNYLTMSSNYDPEDEVFDSDSRYDFYQEIHEELADYNESFSRSEEGGWFYSDED